MLHRASVRLHRLHRGSPKPEVDALIAAAIAQSDNPLPDGGKGKLIIHSISAEQRPRRKSASDMQR